MSNDNSPGLIEPNPKEIVLCVYEPTLDGFAAAWVVRKAFKANEIPVEFAFPPIHDVDFSGRNVIKLGMSTLPGSGASRSFLHLTTSPPDSSMPLPFKDWERVFPYGVKTMTREPHKIAAFRGASVVGAAWDFFFADKLNAKRPFLVDQIDDHVSGTRKFRDSADTYACADTYPQDFMTFDRLVEVCEDRRRRNFVIAGGQAVNRFLAKHAGRALRIEAVT